MGDILPLSIPVIGYTCAEEVTIFHICCKGVVDLVGVFPVELPRASAKEAVRHQRTKASS